MLIAIPAFRVSCSVGINKGRAWSVVDEVMLWATADRPRTIAELAEESNLARQIVVASLARLMRFRLVELKIEEEGARFGTSGYGGELVKSGRPLPFFPKREKRRVSFVVEQATGAFFPAGQVRVASTQVLTNDPDPDVRVVVVEGGGPAMTHEANMARLSDIAARGWEEQLALVDGRTATIKSEYMLIRIVDGVPRNIPDAATETLKRMIADIAALPFGGKQIAVEYAGTQQGPDAPPAVHEGAFDPSDLVVGGSAQLSLFRRLIAEAHTRMIIHSTFLDHNRFRELADELRSACIRGVTFDLLWGAEVAEGTDNRNVASAVAIARIIREDRDLNRRFHIHMRSTGSHAKVLLADDERGDWIAAVGSCNWLSTPFRAVEMTTVLRDPHVVADVAVAVQRMVGRRGLSDDIATEMSLLAADLRRMPLKNGPAKLSLIVGEGHESIMRQASGRAARRVVVGTHRLGSTARPGMVMQAEAAVERASVDVTLIYTQSSGPLKNRHARKLTEEAAANGVKLYKAPIPLHGKFVAWDADDIVVTSLNWGSATSDADFPQADIGVHIEMAGVADWAMERVEAIFPEIVATKEGQVANAAGVTPTPDAAGA